MKPTTAWMTCNTQMISRPIWAKLHFMGAPPSSSVGLPTNTTSGSRSCQGLRGAGRHRGGNQGCPLAYEEPRPLKFHLDDLGAAAGRAAELADPDLRVRTRDQVLTAGDYLSAYVLEWTLHHLDLIAHLPDAAEPPADGLARSRAMLETIAGTALPASFSDTDA